MSFFVQTQDQGSAAGAKRSKCHYDRHKHAWWTTCWIL